MYYYVNFSAIKVSQDSSGDYTRTIRTDKCYMTKPLDHHHFLLNFNFNHWIRQYEDENTSKNNQSNKKYRYWTGKITTLVQRLIFHYDVSNKYYA